MNGYLNKTVSLMRFILRRERIISAIWIALLALFAVGLGPAPMDQLFDAESRYALAETLNSPAMVAMMGPVFGMDDFHGGAMYTVTMVLWILLTVGVMNIFLIVRHTRADEERGRAEVVRSLPAGRLANLCAALSAAAIVNFLLGAVIALGLWASGNDMGLSGTALYGFVIFATGMFFAALTAVFCQLSSSSRGAAGYAFLALGVLYMMRAAGDMGTEALSYISALGLAQRSQIYIENIWWPSAALLLEAAVLAVTAFALNAVRDLGQGMIPARRGRAEAPKSLSSSFGLSLRLLKGQLIVWITVIFLLGASYASVLGDIDSFIESSEFYQGIIGVNPNFPLTEMFAAMVNNIMALVCLIPLISAALKPRGEESDGRAEHILSRTVSRPKYLSGYVILAFAASVLLQFANAFGLYLTASAMPDVDLSFSFLMKANLVYLPAQWALIGAAVLLVGLLPKASAAIWGYYGFTFFGSFIGRTIDLPDWISGLQPFHYIPQLPVDEINPLPLAVLTLAAAALTAVGFVFYRRRDMLTV